MLFRSQGTNTLIIQEDGYYSVNAMVYGHNTGPTVGLQFNLTINGITSGNANTSVLSFQDEHMYVLINTIVQLTAGDEVGLNFFSVSGLNLALGPDKNINLTLIKIG